MLKAATSRCASRIPRVNESKSADPLRIHEIVRCDWHHPCYSSRSYIFDSGFGRGRFHAGELVTPLEHGLERLARQVAT